MLSASPCDAPRSTGFAVAIKVAGAEHVYVEDADDRGHRVSTDAKTLASIYEFFAKHLRD